MTRSVISGVSPAFLGRGVGRWPHAVIARNDATPRALISARTPKPSPTAEFELFFIDLASQLRYCLRPLLIGI
jgi:hypothetical protein